MGSEPHTAHFCISIFLYLIPQTSMEPMIGFRGSPKGLSEYSTRTGTSGKTVFDMSTWLLLGNQVTDLCVLIMIHVLHYNKGKKTGG